MLYIVYYRSFEIVRDNPNKPFQIRKSGSEKFLPGEFEDFASARRECDYLASNRGRIQ